MKIEIFHKIENKIKDLLTEFENDLIDHQKKTIIIDKLILELELIRNNQISISNKFIALMDEIYLSHIYRGNIKSQDSDFEYIYQNIEKNSEKHKYSQDENIKTISLLKSKLSSVKESLIELELKIKHSSILLSYFGTFYSSTSNLEILDDYRFCPPMNIGYDLENRLPISFEWVDKSFTYGINFNTSEKPVIQLSNNQIKHNDKIINLNNEDLAYLLSIVKCFNLRSKDLQLDYLIIPNKYQDKVEIDIVIDGSTILNRQQVCGKIYTEEFNFEWSGKYENAPLRIKLLLDFINLNYFTFGND
jgi:hypothetical protein